MSRSLLVTVPLSGCLAANDCSGGNRIPAFVRGQSLFTVFLYIISLDVFVDPGLDESKPCASGKLLGAVVRVDQMGQDPW